MVGEVDNKPASDCTDRKTTKFDWHSFFLGLYASLVSGVTYFLADKFRLAERTISFFTQRGKSAAAQRA
jgi:hypothetical protein